MHHDWALALHGGAYNDVREGPADQQKAFLDTLIPSQAAALEHGASALEVVVATVAAMEDSGLFNAGKGSVATADGHVELDASLMDGSNLKAGAVASIRRFKNPIHCARAVMEKTPHVLLVGPGAEKFLCNESLEVVPDSYFTHATTTGGSGCDTIGAVARDKQGRLAVATSTGGLAGKRSGRVGDSPVIGAGSWADAYAAVSCTGQGEYFIRSAAASRVASLIEYAKLPITKAAEQVVKQVGDLGGSGGLIAVSATGEVALPFNSTGMVRGWAVPGHTEVQV